MFCWETMAAFMRSGSYANPGAQFDVRFAVRPFDIIFSHVSKSMYCEGNP